MSLTHLEPLPLEPLRLGPHVLRTPTVLAPMAGVTDRDFRLIIRRIGGVGLVTMEFISSKMLMMGDKRIRKILTYEDEERPLSIQIYGSDARTMADAARVVEERGADIVDINMGCPANKVLKGCAGAALMGDLGLAEEIVREVRRAVSIPVTVKFRLGLDDRRMNFLELGKICEQEGADAVALHARTAKQRFSGSPDWSRIALLKETLGIPVLGNGDIRTADDALERIRQTGCNGVLVGRGATRNPWIFKQIAARASNGLEAEPTLEDRRRLIVGHFEALIEREDEAYALHKMRTFTQWYSHGIPEGHKIRRQIQKQPTCRALIDVLERHIERHMAEGESALRGPAAA
ncbi:MAG: tRNA dihydrouridine synthase DusB [Acidobacteriota bacterium]